MIEVVITACSILFSGPIDSVNAPELKNGTCREFHEQYDPASIAYGEADNPIFVQADPHQTITAAQCVQYGEVTIKKWLESHPYYINKWRCDSHAVRQDI